MYYCHPGEHHIAYAGVSVSPSPQAVKAFSRRAFARAGSADYNHKSTLWDFTCGPWNPSDHRCDQGSEECSHCLDGRADHNRSLSPVWLLPSASCSASS